MIFGPLKFSRLRNGELVLETRGALLSSAHRITLAKLERILSKIERDAERIRRWARAKPKKRRRSR